MLVLVFVNATHDWDSILLRFDTSHGLSTNEIMAKRATLYLHEVFSSSALTPKPYICCMFIQFEDVAPGRQTKAYEIPPGDGPIFELLACTLHAHSNVSVDVYPRFIYLGRVIAECPDVSKRIAKRSSVCSTRIRR